MDLLNCKEKGPDLLEAVTGLLNLLLDGRCPATVAPVLFGGNLIGLDKKDGGIRPIAIGYVWRRLAAKCANSYAITRLASRFSPTQLGVGVKGGCEAAVHASRRFVEGMVDGSVFVKLDFRNAFNCLRRDALLESVFREIHCLIARCTTIDWSSYG